VIDHITIRVESPESSAFYRLALELLESTSPVGSGESLDWGDFSMAPATEERPLTQRLHIAFQARDRDQVDTWWNAMREAGHPDLGAPGPRPQYDRSYYGAFIADPAGNSVEAVHHQPHRHDDASLDHVWIRVTDLHASTRFYATIAPSVGYRVTTQKTRIAIHRTGSASLSLVEGPPTTDLHLAFAARDNATVDAFHTAGTSAGYTSLGPPGERLIYHPGYYGAFLADPDNNNIEAVCHNRG
jgi:catechol 2,3-dioxygenase-like lactoylglutathione lyase family enzyme